MSVAVGERKTEEEVGSGIGRAMAEGGGFGDVRRLSYRIMITTTVNEHSLLGDDTIEGEYDDVSDSDST